MKSLTIRLPDDVAERLERESQDRGLSKSDLVRERLNQNAPSHSADRSLMEVLESAWAAPAGVRRKLRSPAKRRIAQAVRAKKLPRR
jgi:hypothetical protein